MYETTSVTSPHTRSEKYTFNVENMRNTVCNLWKYSLQNQRNMEPVFYHSPNALHCIAMYETTSVTSPHTRSEKYTFENMRNTVCNLWKWIYRIREIWKHLFITLPMHETTSVTGPHTRSEKYIWRIWNIQLKNQILELSSVSLIPNDLESMHQYCIHSIDQ